MDIEQTRTLIHDASKVIILLLLVLVLWFAAVWVGVLSCSAVPMGCDLYWTVMRFDEGGKPRILILYTSGTDPGLGDPFTLERVLSNPKIVNVRPRVQTLDVVNIGNLREYDLVIVTKAKQISTSKLKMFIEYVKNGGRLVWTGDAGTLLVKGDEYLHENERESCETGQEIEEGKEGDVIGPWARLDDSECIDFDELISLSYVENYCDFKSCESVMPKVGYFHKTESETRLVRGLRTNLEAYGDFAIVEQAEGGINTKIILNIDTKSDLIADGNNLGRFFPMIVASGLGGKVVYYAIPPELFMTDDMPTDKSGNPIRYSLFIENMYYALLQ